MLRKALFSAAVLLLGSSAGFADVVYDGSVTPVNIAAGSVPIQVFNATPPSTTTVNISGGNVAASVGSPTDPFVFPGDSINAFDGAIVNLSGGTLLGDSFFVGVGNPVQFNVSGGQSNGNVTVDGAAQFIMSAGTIVGTQQTALNLGVSVPGTVGVIAGGTIGAVGQDRDTWVGNNAQLVAAGGQFLDDIHVIDTGALLVPVGSTAVVSGDLEVGNTAAAVINGGTFQKDIQLFNSAQVLINAGTISGNLNPTSASSDIFLTVLGSYTVTNNPIGGPTTTTYTTSQILNPSDVSGTITGFYTNSQPFTVSYLIPAAGGQIHIAAVPEPAAFMLIPMAAGLAWGTRRVKSWYVAR